jgi:hypothetical protein
MKRLLLYILGSAALVACSSDDDNTTATPAPVPFTLEVTENPMTEDGEPAATRGTTVNSTSFNEFTMSSYNTSTFSEYHFKKKDGVWSTDKDWPADEYYYPLAFYAHHNGGTLIRGTVDTNAYLSVTVEGEPTNQKDILAANTKVYEYSERGSTVSLTFDHICAAVDFNVLLSNTLAATHSTVMVTGLTLKNIYSHGNYWYNEETKWQNQSAKANYVLDNRSEISVTTTPTAINKGTLFLIPQTQAANGTEGPYMEVAYKSPTDNSAKVANIPFDINWSADYHYTINIKLGTSIIQ